MDIRIDLNSSSSSRARRLALELLTARLNEDLTSLGPLTQAALATALAEAQAAEPQFLYLLIFWQAYISSALAGFYESAAAETGEPIGASELIQQIALALERAGDGQ